MSRTPVILCLFGLGLSVLGAYLMLRVLVPSLGGMGDNPLGADAEALRQSAGSDVFSTYVIMTGSGFAVFAAGLAMLWGRRQG